MDGFKPFCYSPIPGVKAAVKMNRFRLVGGTVEMIRMPETVTAANRKVVSPPNTGLGMATKAAANLENMPMMKRKKQHA